MVVWTYNLNPGTWEVQEEETEIPEQQRQCEIVVKQTDRPQP